MQCAVKCTSAILGVSSREESYPSGVRTRMGITCKALPVGTDISPPFAKQPNNGTDQAPDGFSGLRSGDLRGYGIP